MWPNYLILYFVPRHYIGNKDDDQDNNHKKASQAPVVILSSKPV